MLRARALWLLARRQEGQATDRLRPVVRCRGLPGGGRSVRRQYRRPDDAVHASRQAQAALRLVTGCAGWRPWHDHQRPHSRRAGARAGLDWITALRAPQIRALLDAGAFQLSLFDERDLAEITAPDFPGERLVVCKNPLLAEERVRQREDLLRASEAAFAKLADKIAHRRGPKGKDKIGRALGRIENRYKLAKHFDIAIGEEGFTFHRNQARIAEEARLDGFYVIRTSVEGTTLAADNVVGAYKSLARVERAFRSLKTVDLHLRPIHHWLAPRVRAHVFLCGLACHVEWHMRERLKPVLFDDDDPTAAARQRASIVATAQPAPAALSKRASKITPDGTPVHSFQSLLRDLATCTLNEMTTILNNAYTFTLVTTPTPVHARAFTLLGIDPAQL